MSFKKGKIMISDPNANILIECIWTLTAISISYKSISSTKNATSSMILVSVNFSPLQHAETNTQCFEMKHQILNALLINAISHVKLPR